MIKALGGLLMLPIEIIVLLSMALAHFVGFFLAMLLNFIYLAYLLISRSIKCWLRNSPATEEENEELVERSTKAFRLLEWLYDD